MGFVIEDRYFIKSCETAKVMEYMLVFRKIWIVNWTENSDKGN